MIIMRLLLLKLINMGKWGGAHTSLGNIKKGLPSRYVSNNKGIKLVKKAIKELIDKRFFLVKPSTGESHVSLNPGEVKKINGFLIKMDELID